MIPKLLLILIFSIFLYPSLTNSVDADNTIDKVQITDGADIIGETETWSDIADEKLQSALDQLISSRPKWKKLASKKLLSVGLVDLQDMEHKRYASVNGRNMVYAASLPKIAVLLAAVESIEVGSLVLDSKLDKDLRLMCAKSNNQATTRVIERLGFERIAKVLQSAKYKFYDKKAGGGLWVGKKYAKSGKRYPDPMKGISHAATVEQVCRFYTMLAEGKLVSKKGNALMKKYLVNPEINHKFVKSLNKVSPGARIFRKSGSWRTYHADSALIEGKNGRKYVLVALIQDLGGSKICEDLVFEVEKLLKAIPVTSEAKS